MRKLLLILFFLNAPSLSAQDCGFDKMHQRLMQADPVYRLNVDAMNQKWVSEQAFAPNSMPAFTSHGTDYIIPVVVHVIHTGGAVGTLYNPSDSTIHSVIDYLNETYAATYSGYPDTNNGGVRFPVKFQLAKRSPGCTGTAGINRVNGSILPNYSTYGIKLMGANGVSDTSVKALSRWNHLSYYNIWVVNKIDSYDGTSGGGVNGYALFPGAQYYEDGTVILAGLMAKGIGTLPHEMGHAFGLYHTFEGDGNGPIYSCPTNTNCLTDGDLICDTEPHMRDWNCPTNTTNTCLNTPYNNTVAKNMMSYFSCRDRFTSGQRARLLSQLMSGRPGLMSSMAVLPPDVNAVTAACSTATANPLHASGMGPRWVKLNDLSHSSGGANTEGSNYIDHTCQLRANLVQGKSYTLQVVTALNGQDKSVFIDYNNDGAYTIAERVADLTHISGPAPADTLSSTITIPISGITTCTPLRMRVITDFYGSPAIPATACGTLAYGQTEDYTVYIKPAGIDVAATIEGTNPICSPGGRGVYAVSTNIALTNPSYQWYVNAIPAGSNAAIYSAAGLSGGAYIQCKINYTGNCNSNPDSVFSNIMTVRSTADTNVWTGQTNTAYTTVTNWSCGSLPSASTTASFPRTGYINAPSLSAGTYSVKNLWLDDNRTLSIAAGAALHVKEQLTLDTATITGSGVVVLNGITAQSILGTGSMSNLTLNNSSGAGLGGVLTITDTYTPALGTLTTGGNLVLKSTPGTTARIAAGAPGGGYLSGAVKVEKYIPGKRAYRFMAHPFSSALALTELTDDMDITGGGGSANGFTATGSNNSSAYWWDVSTADNTSTGDNPGWKAFTHTNGAGANAWNPYKGLRVLVRGAIGEGLWGAAYTPSAVTVDMSGSLNQGDQAISLTKGSNSNFVMVGNPFASQVDLMQTTRSNMGNAFYTWDATIGTSGGYSADQFSGGSSSYILPAYASFITTLTANGSVTFPETCKSPGTDAGLFRTTAADYKVALRIEDSTLLWDRFLLRFADSGSRIFDHEEDAQKLYNPVISFYSFSKEDTLLSIDSRPYTDKEIIRLGLYCPLQQSFRIRAAALQMPPGTHLYLKDRYLNKVEEITGAGYDYWFSVTADSSSRGNSRFELHASGIPSMVNTEMAAGPAMQLIPNPTTGKIVVYYSGSAAGGKQLTVTDTRGMQVMHKLISEGNSSGAVELSLEGLPAGMYLVHFRDASGNIHQKLIKL